MRPLLSRTAFIVAGLLLLTTAYVYSLANRSLNTILVSQLDNTLATDSPNLAKVGTSIGSANPSTPLKISLIMAKAPKLNEPVNVKVTVRSVLDAPDTTAELEIPEWAVLVSGTTNFQGDLGKNETAEFEAVIKFIKVGNTTIKAITKKVVSQDMVWGDVAYIYLTVGKESSQFGFDYSPFSPGGQMP